MEDREAQEERADLISRTFALSIRFLPGNLGRTVGVQVTMKF